MSFPFFRAEVFSVRAHGSYGVFAVDVPLTTNGDLLLAREMTQSAHDLADPYVRYSAARRQFLQSRLQDVRLGLERLIDSLSPSESF
jgi:hypothetical protein